MARARKRKITTSTEAGLSEKAVTYATRARLRKEAKEVRVEGEQLLKDIGHDAPFPLPLLIECYKRADAEVERVERLVAKSAAKYEANPSEKAAAQHTVAGAALAAGVGGAGALLDLILHEYKRAGRQSSRQRKRT